MLNLNTFILANHIENYLPLIEILEKDAGVIYSSMQPSDLIDNVETVIKSMSTDVSTPMIFIIEQDYVESISEYLTGHLNPAQYILVVIYNNIFPLAATCGQVFDTLHSDVSLVEMEFLVKKLHTEINNRLQLASLQFETAKLYEIGKSLSSEKDTLKLLDLVIQSSMSLTASDAATIYLIVEKDTGRWSSVKSGNFEGLLLKYAITKNNSIDITPEIYTSSITHQSISGYTVISGRSLRIDDAYEMNPSLRYRHDRSFDSSTGYRTKSILSIPMKDHENNILGVIQLINKQKNKSIVPFDHADELLMNSLAGQAAVALENNLLYREMNQLLENYKQQNNELLALSRRILSAHEDERKRVAREIHDGPAQSVVNLSFKLELCKRYLQNQDLTMTAIELDNLLVGTRSTTREIRTIIYDLKPSHLEDGLFTSLKNRIDVFSDTTGIKTVLNTSGNDEKIEYYLAITGYNVVQESLNNIYKHAEAKNVFVKVSVNETELRISILDDGKGFDTNIIEKKKNRQLEGGFGMEGMLERVELVRGNISIESTPGSGTCIRAVLPLK